MEHTAIKEKNILIVDDDEDLLELQKIILINQNYNVFTANGGTEALKQFKNKKDEIDLVVLDIQMPDISGKEVYNEIKFLRPDIKVLISSGYDKNTALEGITLDSGDSFIQKPSTRAVFVQNVRELLKK